MEPKYGIFSKAAIALVLAAGVVPILAAPGAAFHPTSACVGTGVGYKVSSQVSVIHIPLVGDPEDGLRVATSPDYDAGYWNFHPGTSWEYVVTGVTGYSNATNCLVRITCSYATTIPSCSLGDATPGAPPQDVVRAALTTLDSGDLAAFCRLLGPYEAGPPSATCQDAPGGLPAP